MQPVSARTRPMLQDDMPPVMCPECQTWFHPAEHGGWNCPDCGGLAVWAYQPCTCPGCLQPRHTMRVGYDLSRVNCDCHLTEEQRRRAAQELAQRRDREQRKREWDQAARQQEREMAQAQRDAADCLRARGGNCHESRPPRAPYPMCASCTINTQAPARNPRQSRQDDRWQRFGT